MNDKAGVHDGTRSYLCVAAMQPFDWLLALALLCSHSRRGSRHAGRCRSMRLYALCVRSLATPKH